MFVLAAFKAVWLPGGLVFFLPGVVAACVNGLLSRLLIDWLPGLLLPGMLLPVLMS